MHRVTSKGLWILVAGTAVAALILAGIAILSVTTVQAGGVPQPMYQAISDMLQAGNTVTIWTRTPVYKGPSNIYPIHMHDIGKDFFLTRLGTDVICLQMSVPAPSTAAPVCVPFSSIDFFSYGK